MTGEGIPHVIPKRLGSKSGVFVIVSAFFILAIITFYPSTSGSVTLVDTNKELVVEEKLGKGTVSYKEAQDLLGGWYVPDAFDVMALENGVSRCEEAAAFQDEEPSKTNCDEKGDSIKNLFEHCGPWMQKYADFHKQARARAKHGAVYEHRSKYITFTCIESGTGCVGGLGDTLVGVATAFLVALATDRVLLIDWDVSLNTVFEPAGIDWRIDPTMAQGQEGMPVDATWLDKRKKGVTETGAGGQSKVWVTNLVNFSNVPDPGEAEHSLRFVVEQYLDVDHIVMTGNRGILTRTLMGHDKEWVDKLIDGFGLRPPIAFGCIIRLLLRVIPSVLEEVAPTIRMLQGNSLCIHARADDMESGFTIQWDVNATETLEMKEAIDFQMWKWKGIFDCADSLSNFWFPPSPSFKWFFMTSSAVLKEGARRRYGDKVIMSDIVPRHTMLVESSAEVYRSSVAEWALFTSCTKFLITESGFSKTSAGYALKPRSTWVFTRPAHGVREVRPTYECPLETPTTTEDLGYSWSGL